LDFRESVRKQIKPPVLKMYDGRILQIYRDGNRHTAMQRLQLPPGAEGNLVTLREMARIVREDSQFDDIGRFVWRNIIGLEKKSLPVLEQIDAAFYFCRDQIVYEQEKQGFETVADLWSTLYKLDFRGDCALKSVALATCLCFLNLKPYFIALQQIPNADFFNHVFVAVEVNEQVLFLDATPKDFLPGQRLTAIRRLEYPIFFTK
jgi:hypothetical protein